jgi:hypothetical protein
VRRYILLFAMVFMVLPFMGPLSNHDLRAFCSSLRCLLSCSLTSSLTLTLAFTYIFTPVLTYQFTWPFTRHSTRRLTYLFSCAFTSVLTGHVSPASRVPIYSDDRPALC